MKTPPPYTTSKSNLVTQELDEDTLAALKLHPPEKGFQALLRILEEQEENMELTQPRTGNLSARAHFLPRAKEPEEQLLALLHRVGARIQEATNDGRAYTIEIKITANLTVEPWAAEVGEYVHPNHFQPNLGTQDQILESPSLAIEKRTFQPTPQGFQRIE